MSGDAFHYQRDFASTNKDGTVAGQGETGHNSQGQSATRLECHRPLIYEPETWKKAMCSDNFGQQGQRKARRIPSLVLSGSFRIRLSEGTNNVDGWVGGTRIDMPDPMEGMGEEENQNVKTFDKDGFGSVQFVRVLGIIVHDMGDGYGNFGGIDQGTTVQNDLPLSNNYNMYNPASSSLFHHFTENINNRHLLAPSISDIFEGYHQDPAGDMTANHGPTVGEDSDRWYRHEEIIQLKYKKNTASGTPNALSISLPGDVDVGTFLHDPLRGDKRSRSFHVFHDKIIAFTPRGTSTATVNQEGSRQHDMKWSVKMTGNRFCQDVRKEHVVALHAHEHGYTGDGSAAEFAETGPISVGSDLTIQTQEATRTVEGANKRIFWYFLPSISTHVNGRYRGATGIGTDSEAAQTIVSAHDSNINKSNLHHWFTVTRGPEKCFFVEKDDE